MYFCISHSLAYSLFVLQLMDWMYLCLAILCIVSAALASGLTLGLLSLDRLKLKSKLHSGTKSEKNYAARLFNNSDLPILSSY